MSAAEPLATSTEFDSAKSILTELTGIYSEQAEIKESLEAKGVPAATINMLINLSASKSEHEFEKICTSALRVAETNAGSRAIKQDQLVASVNKLVELDEDALYIRRIAKSMGFNAQAISMLTNIIRQNPGDNGVQVISELFRYATEYGIEVSGLKGVSGSEPVKDSVLPEIVIEKPELNGILRYRNLFVELLVALVATCTVLQLLT